VSSCSGVGVSGGNGRAAVVVVVVVVVVVAVTQGVPCNTPKDGYISNDLVDKSIFLWYPLKAAGEMLWKVSFLMFLLEKQARSVCCCSNCFCHYSECVPRWCLKSC